MKHICFKYYYEGDNMIYCLFEQSGTFKNIFKSKGYDAIDIDIENQFDNTDLQIDLFAAIEKLPNGYLGNITSDDLIIAFFPCTWFCDNNMLLFSGKAYQMHNWTDEQKTEYIHKRRHERIKAFTLLQKLIRHCNKYKIPLIVENPVSHYLISTLGKYTIAHRRDKYGDVLQKRTMYYCYNCTINENKMTKYDNKVTGNNVQTKLRGINRSLISSNYAANLINAIESEVIT